MRFRKSEGLTPSEQVLASLCERSFLKLWTYPNLFKQPGKELTDLLVVFHHDVLIFSDKSCAYPQTGNSHLNWRRWYRRAISHSAHQIYEAERWIRCHPDRVFLDARCEQRVPLPLPRGTDLRVHRICVATGATRACLEATGSDGLRIDLSVQGDAEPFTLGNVEQANACLHVFDDTSLGIVLSQLSTVSDFVAYLDAKARLFADGTFRKAGGELDLLATYVWNGRRFPVAPEFGTDLWAQVEANSAFQAARDRNRVSEFWDGLIEHLTEHFLRETLELGNELEMNDYEKIVRVMASESRFHRRVLSLAILERAEVARSNKIATLLPSESSDFLYVLLIGRGASQADYAEYRADRGRELQLRCYAAKAARPEIRFLIGIALDAPGGQGGSEDLIYVDTTSWTAETIRQAQNMRDERRYFVSGSMLETQFIEDEYPPAT